MAAEVKALGYDISYEAFKVRYIRNPATYTPDFPFRHNGIIVETKGRFLPADRSKHLLIKKQHPDLDIRFVFSSSRTRISKQSQTTYAMWCDRHGFLYADRSIPLQWLEEPPAAARMEALSNLIHSPRKTSP